MNKYTEADVNRTHQATVETLIDLCIQSWKDSTEPLNAKMWYQVAAKLEEIREADYDSWTMARILNQANMNAQEQNA